MTKNFSRVLPIVIALLLIGLFALGAWLKVDEDNKLGKESDDSQKYEDEEDVTEEFGDEDKGEPADNDEEGTVTSASCPSGTVWYADTSLNIGFCVSTAVSVHPYRGHLYFRSVQRVNPQEDILELAVATYDAPPEIFLLEEVANLDAAAKNITCAVIEEKKTHGSVYLIIGYPTGAPDEQSLETVTICRDSSRYSGYTTYTPEWFFFKNEEPQGSMIIVTGGQDFQPLDIEVFFSTLQFLR